MVTTAKIHEIFTSIQGEGIFSGKRQIFIRFFGCNLKCRFCDTVQDLSDAKEYTADDLLSAVQQKATSANVHSVSITGGEPLVHYEFLKIVLPKLKQCSYRVYLDTNGTMPAGLADVIDYVDMVAMDIKLPSSTAGAELWKQHSQFLSVAMKKLVFVKVVVTDMTTYDDIYKAADLVAAKNPYIAFVIQPVSPQAGIKPADPNDLENFKNIASERLYRVRVIPQMHKLFGIR